MIALLLEKFRDDGLCHIVRLLPYDIVVGILAKHILPQDRTTPILAVASYLSMSGMLSCHKGATAGRAHRAAGIGISKSHPFLRHTVDVGSGDEPLPIASQVAITHVVTHYIYYIIVWRLSRQSKRKRSKERYKIEFRIHCGLYFGTKLRKSLEGTKNCLTFAHVLSPDGGIGRRVGLKHR